MILGLGAFCQELLGSEAFSALTQMYSQQCAADILSTKPEEGKNREQIYAAYMGFEGFLALAKKFADAHIALQNETASADTTEADIDDPRVHDIYDGQN
jgi:hypothetical protein